LFNWLSNLFSRNPSRAKAVEALGWCDALMCDEMMWGEVRRVVRSAISQYGFKNDLSLTTDLKAAKVILQAVYNQAASQVHTGAFHTYRGVLSMRGTSLRNIAELALSEMRENQCITDKEYDDALSDLRDGISEVG